MKPPGIIGTLLHLLAAFAFCVMLSITNLLDTIFSEEIDAFE